MTRIARDLIRELERPTRQAMLERAPSVQKFWSENTPLFEKAWAEWGAEHEAIHGQTLDDSIYATNLRVAVDNAWQNQLIKDDFIAQLERVSTQGEGCAQENHYRLIKNDETIELVWLPAQDLLKSFSVKRGDNEIRWQQDSVSHDPQTINAFFARRAEFQTTDFADIGDDHTDPFLTNMVHQGFIEAGASGFYDVDGNAIGEHHH